VTGQTTPVLQVDAQRGGRGAGASYDAVPYESHAIPNTSPDALATMGTLFGMRPAGTETCRVLELGCAGAGNLVAMALPLPRARLLGIDASSRQIEMGRALAAQIGVSNVELAAVDLEEFPSDSGEFDYIVCHGVYSWVSPLVQDRILEIFARHLAPQGIAYLSYNTFPGGHLLLMAREMMRFHVGQIPDPVASAARARALPEFLKAFAKDPQGVYQKFLENLCKDVSESTDSYVLHEYLEEHNSPVFFTDLLSRCAQKGLQYLAPANFISWEHNLPDALEQILARLSNRLLREQYLDFLSNRGFRRTLLCRADVPIAQAPQFESVQGLQVRGRARPVRENPDVCSEAEEEFVTATDDRLSTRRPLVKATLKLLADTQPRAIPVEALPSVLAAPLAGGADANAGLPEFARVLLRCHTANLVTLHTGSPSFADSPGAHPVASPLARVQAARGEPAVNLWHESLDLEDLDRVVLPLLDGTRDRAAIAEALGETLSDGCLRIEDAAGTPLEDPGHARRVVASALEESLQRLAKACLLTA
jgi:methyltransferase-like protein/ubiquinone/menaquinone biosynthesis C-methylase UbiE